LEVTIAITDVGDAKMYSGRLSDEGDALIVTHNAIPSCLKDSQACEDQKKPEYQNEQTKMQHDAFVTEIDPHEDTVTKVESHYFFPKDIYCSNQHFNANAVGTPPPDDYMLHPKLLFRYLAKGEKTYTCQYVSVPGANPCGKEVTCTCGVPAKTTLSKMNMFVCFMMAIEGSETGVAPSKKAQADDILASQLKGLGFDGVDLMG
jgi:hypothetical protein